MINDNNLYENCDIYTHIIINNKCILVYDYIDKYCYYGVNSILWLLLMIVGVMYFIMLIRMIKAKILPNDGHRPKIIILINIKICLLIVELTDLNGYRGMISLKVINSFELVGILILFYVLDIFIVDIFMERSAPYVYNRYKFLCFRQIIQTFCSVSILCITILWVIFFDNYYWQFNIIQYIIYGLMLMYLIFTGLIALYYVLNNANVCEDIALLKENINQNRLSRNLKFSYQLSIMGIIIICAGILSYIYLSVLIQFVIKSKANTGSIHFHETYQNEFSCSLFIQNEVLTLVQLITMLTATIALKAPVRSMEQPEILQRIQSFSFSQRPQLIRPLTRTIGQQQRHRQRQETIYHALLYDTKRAIIIIFTPLIRAVGRIIFLYDLISDILLALVLYNAKSYFFYIISALIVLPHVISAVLLFPYIYKRIEDESWSKDKKYLILAIILFVVGYLPFVVFIDIVLVSWFLFRSTNDYSRLVFYERLRFITETLFEAIPQLSIQFVLATNSSVVNVDQRILYASILGSILSTARAFWIIRRGSLLHNISSWEYMKNLFSMGYKTLPHADSLLRKTATDVAWKNLNASQLYQALKLVEKCPSCKILNLSNNSQVFNTEQGWDFFLRYIRKCTRIRKLFLSNNNLTSDQIIELIQTLRIHNGKGAVLRKLWLNGNELNDVSLSHICDKLIAKNVAIKFLHLGNCTNFTKDIWLKLYTALLRNHHIQAIVIYMNKSYDADCIELANKCKKLMQVNSVLTLREDVVDDDPNQVDDDDDDDDDPSAEELEISDIIIHNNNNDNRNNNNNNNNNNNDNRNNTFSSGLDVS